MRKEKGFVILGALFLALIYFASVELLLADTTARLLELRRTRARMAAEILADNAVELSADSMVVRLSVDAEKTTEEGTMMSTYRTEPDGTFVIEANAVTAAGARARVQMRGRVTGTSISILRTRHSG